MTRTQRLVALITLASLAILPSCATDARTKALVGGGLGALLGQAIGGDTESTLIGAGVGTGLGYILGNEQDKSEAARRSETTPRGQLVQHEDVGQLGGTRWRVTEIVPSSAFPAAKSRVIEFDRTGRVRTARTNLDGTIERFDESFRVQDDTLIVNRPGLMINASFHVRGDELRVYAEEFRATLTRV